MTEINSKEICDADFLSNKGKIISVDDINYYVSIAAQSACSSCHSKGVCGLGDTKEKVIEVPRKSGESYNIGDTVEILMNKSMGAQAVIIGYIFPFVLLLATLILVIKFTENEGIAGISAIGSVALYYFFLYLFKDKFKKRFRFNIRSLG